MEPEKKIYTGTAAKILNWMQKGLNQTQAAQAVGVDVSYAHQLSKEESFKQQIKEALKLDFEKTIEIERNYREIEHQLTQDIKDLLPMEPSLTAKLAALRIITAAKPKASAVGAPEGSNSDTKSVTLVLPNVIIQNFTMNPNSEVVSVGDRNLTTIGSATIDGLAKRVLEEELIENQNMPIPKIDIPKHVKVATNERSQQRSQDKWGNL